MRQRTRVNRTEGVIVLWPECLEHWGLKCLRHKGRSTKYGDTSDMERAPNYRPKRMYMDNEGVFHSWGGVEYRALNNVLVILRMHGLVPLI